MHRVSRFTFLAIALSLVSLILLYAPLRLAQLAALEVSQLGLALGCWVLPIAGKLLHENIQSAWSRTVSAITMTWIGICFIGLVTLIPLEILLLSTWVDPATGAYLVATLIAALCIYAIYNAQQIHIKNVDIDNSPKHLSGQRIAQISDVHIGSRRATFLQPIVQRLNTLDADIVVITGDLIDMYNISEADLQPLANINAPTFFCIGNHERYVDLEDICQRLRNLGILVLRNQAIQHNGYQIIGIDDAESRNQVAKQISSFEVNNDLFRVLLYHRPDGAQAAANWGVQLMLTGHTHRGQIVPFNFLVKRVFPQYYRSYRIDNLHLYVSPGTGTWGPVMRLGSKCEITLFTLM